MIRRLQIVLFSVLIALGAVPVYGAAPASVSGLVRDSAGVPQIGALVQLLRPDLSIVATVYTNNSGQFKIATVNPGRYSVKAMATSYLPSMREGVRVRANTVVNLTLNTLYEVMQWLPSEPRPSNAQADDWKWTLRSAANRPLLRWLEDGPLVVVSDDSGRRPRLKARLVASGQEGAFGESGERISATVEDTPANSRELLARVDFAPGTDAGMESMLGFRQDLGYAGAVQSVAAVSLHPEIAGPQGDGLAEIALRAWETVNLGDEFEVEAGSNQVVARLASSAQPLAAAVLPFASLGWRKANSTLRYRMATMSPAEERAENSPAENWLPRLTVRNGALTIERGLHQELGWERLTDASGISVLVFADRIESPVLEAATRLADGAPSEGMALLDRVSGILRTAGPDFSSAGMQATYERKLSSGSRVRLSYANGNALVMSAPTDTAPQTTVLTQALAGVHPRRAQMYALSLSGTLDGTGTRWRASYRWQPSDTVTQVAPFAINAAEPYLNLHLRQPIRLGREGSLGFEALLDVRNLLAEGYRPYLSSDGSMLIFAQEQRTVRAGLAFTF